MKKTYPIQDLLKAGVPFCFSTDAPATSWAVPSDPFPCLKGGVTRTAWDGTDCGPEHGVDIETALQLYTREGARVAGFPEMGELKVGYLCDGHLRGRGKGLRVSKRLRPLLFATI